MTDRVVQKKEILRKIENLSKQISHLKSEKLKLEKEFRELLVNPVADNLEVIENTQDKIALYRSLFRGREDVYPRLWQSKTTGKSGYSPACQNEWKSQLCRKFKIKCGDCPNRRFIPLTDQIIQYHLEGRHAIGIYPLLKNDCCFFLALDFDGKGWFEDASAFRTTCRSIAVPVSIERSRSGRGAHAWIFFNEEIPASLARKLGGLLIEKTMSQRFQLKMDSYDRLFPNQDTLPKGGFGNLIALPLQGNALQEGNSLFIDENGEAVHDQWAYLNQIQKMSKDEVKTIIHTESSYDFAAGLWPSELKENIQNIPPWHISPSGKMKSRPEFNDLPKNLEVVLSNKIYIPIGPLPSRFLNLLKQSASFHNPEFYKRQNMRLSTFRTPRIISCAEIDNDYLALPRGLLEEISTTLKEYGISPNISDKRCAGKITTFSFNGSLTKKQTKLLNLILEHDTGILVAPPGTGKTVIAISTIAQRKVNTLILLHRKPLMDQWRMGLSLFLGMDPKEIGLIGGGKNSATGILDLALFQSLERKGLVKELILDYGQIIVDECHHVSAASFERVLSQAYAKYVLGLTATPYRRDGHHPIIHMQCGPIRAKSTRKDVESDSLPCRVFVKKTDFRFDWSEDSKIYKLWPVLLKDEKRNDIIVEDIIAQIKSGRFPLILTERREHLDILFGMLDGKINNIAVLHGGIRSSQRKEILENLRSCPSERSKALLATGSYIGEGFDDPRLDTLFITMPISFKGKIVQYAGRLHRPHKNKKEIQIFDYVDSSVSVLDKMYKNRLKTYRALGYDVKGE